MNYNTLCFSGGGVSAISIIGALKYLIINKYLDLSLINKFVGTSSGAIISFLLSLNYSIFEIYDFILNFNFQTLEPDYNIENLLESYGIDNGDKFNYVFSNFIKNKYNIDDLSFKDLFELSNKSLLIICTNYTKSEEEVFSYDLTPNMSVLLALRMSISIPIFFTPVLYNTYYYVDGGLVNNFPIKYCDLDTTLGFYLESIKKDNKIKNITSIFIDSVKILFYNIAKNTYYKYANKPNIIKLTSILDNVLDFQINYDQKLLLLNNGMNSAQIYIENLNTNEILNLNKYTQTD
jgi:NTE family protein